MKRISIICLSLLTLLLPLSGCGDNRDGGFKASKTLSLKGIVEDGPIEQAHITLRDSQGEVLSLCGGSGILRCETTSDTSGAFSLEISRGLDLSGLSLSAVDGKDRATGADLTGLEMRSPLSLFADAATDEVVVSPLTTLVSVVQNQGVSLAAAQERLREWILLPSAANLAARPSSGIDLQKRAILLTHLALELGTVKAFESIGIEAARVNTALLSGADEACQQEVLRTLGLAEAAQERVISLQSLLRSAKTTEEAVFVYKREELMDVFAANIEQMLSPPAGFDPQNAGYRENLRLLTEKTLLAAGSTIIPLKGTIPQRIVRYVLFTYLPDGDPLDTRRTLSPEILLREAAIFSDSLRLGEVPLENDPSIAELAGSRSRYNVISPLQSDELPGDDNQQRLAYFYGSDLSPHYQAEQVLGPVFDDAINDAILLKIVEGEAKDGLVDDARLLIETQIIQSEPRANAYRAIANTFIKHGMIAEAKEALIEARELYYAIIESKGKASAGDQDILNLYETSKSLSSAGSLEEAAQVLAYLAEIKEAIVGNGQAISLIAAGFKKIADQYIAVGDDQAASPLVDLYYDYAQIVPPNLDAGKRPVSYATRVTLLANAAKLYADLNKAVKVLEIYGKIEDLRLEDELGSKTIASTWTQIPGLIESLFRVGELEEALSLANSIPETQTATRLKSLKLITTIVALRESFDSAYALFAEYFSTPEDRVDALTYNGLTRGRAYIGLALIQAGKTDEARHALQRAEEILEGMTASNNMQRIVYGYVKVAGLYSLLGDTTKALALLQRAIEIIADDEYRVVALAEIALAYQAMNHNEMALQQLANALEGMSVDPSRQRDLAYFLSTKPEAIPPKATTASVYEVLIKAYSEIGATTQLKTTIDLYLSWSQQIHPSGTTDDTLSVKECYYLLRGVLYLEDSGYHAEALQALQSAQEVAGQIAVMKDRLQAQIDIIRSYAKVHENEIAWNKALAIALTDERNLALKGLAEAYLSRDDIPSSRVATIDTDGDGKPDFFNPLATEEEIEDSGLILDDDSDGDGILDLFDLRPLYKD